MRLTNEHREEIARRAIAHGFDVREALLRKEENALAARVYDLAYPAAVRRAMKALPPGFLDTKDSIFARTGGESHWLHFAKGMPVGNLETVRLAADDKLAVEIAAHARRSEACAAEKRTACREVAAVLASVATLVRLIEVWPEVESFTEGVGGGGKPVTALAKPIKAINVALGLPPGEKAVTL